MFSVIRLIILVHLGPENNIVGIINLDKTVLN